MSGNQRQEAASFASRHQRVIRRAQKLILAAFGRIEATLGPSEGLGRARKALASFEVQHLTHAQNRLVEALIPETCQHRRWSFWHLHDMIGALAMALESRWPYQTQQSRAINLSFLHEEARELAACLRNV